MGFSSTGVAIVAVVASATIASCGGATDNPLGGPFGGTIQESVSPTQGTAPDASTGGATSGNPTPAPSTSGSGSSGSMVDPGSGGGNNSSGGSSSSSSSGVTSGSSSGSVGPTSSSSSSSGSSSGVRPSSSSSSGSGSSSGSSGSTSSSSSGMGMGSGPSWSMTIYANDLTQRTCGGLGCHIEWNSASTAYNYLQSQGCLPAMGCIRGVAPTGNMPVIGSVSSSAVADIQAWVAAGSQNN